MLLLTGSNFMINNVNNVDQHSRASIVVPIILYKKQACCPFCPSSPLSKLSKAEDGPGLCSPLTSKSNDLSPFLKAGVTVLTLSFILMSLRCTVIPMWSIGHTSP